MLSQIEVGSFIKIRTIDGYVYDGIVHGKGKLDSDEGWKGFVEIEALKPSGGSVHVFINLDKIIAFYNPEHDEDVIEIED